MPQKTGYKRRQYRKRRGGGRRRLVNNPTTSRAMVPHRRGAPIRYTGGSMMRTVHPAFSNMAAGLAEAVVRQAAQNIQRIPRRGRTKALKDTKNVTRAQYNKHHKLKDGKSGPVNKGKGKSKMGSKGVLYTHPKAVIPKWKHDRLKTYKNDVWQTVLVSKSSRIANSNNILGTFRYPIKAPDALDTNRVQAMVFTPYCSNYSGIHTTFYRKIRADGTDLDHNTAQPLDVIQNKADIQRHSLPGSVEGTGGTTIKYETDVISAATTQSAAELNNVNAYYDQILKGVHLDLVFMASRAFPVRVSVTLVRHLQPTAPHTWTTEDKQQLFNNLGNTGCKWENYKFEYQNTFTIPALQVNKPPPKIALKKVIKTNFMQTNSFNDNNTAEDMAQASLNQLGLGLRRRSPEVADGLTSSNTYLLIKFSKVDTPQQFTYSQTIEADSVFSTGIGSARLTVPVLSESSFDVPVSDGLPSGAGAGFQSTDDPPNNPFRTDQGNESLASFYVHGKIKYQWGFREDVESVPALMSGNVASANYKKNQSLNIDPTITGDTNHGIYTQSQSHQTLAQSTANSGP